MSPAVKRRKRIVVLGIMAVKPVGGVVWQTLHYLAGFERLGCEAYYVEAHARAPTMFVESSEEDGSERAAAFIDRNLRPFGLGDRWALHALHSTGRVYGVSEQRLAELYRTADAIINLHGATLPRPEHMTAGPLVYLETDPVAVQIELAQGLRDTEEYLAQHQLHFTFGERYGRSGCGLPVSERFNFKPTRQPVVLDFWQSADRAANARDLFTTIGNWRQAGRHVVLDGEVYEWSKHLEWLKFLDLPRQTQQAFELALTRYEPDDQRLLEEHGWQVRPALGFSTEIDAYRDYILASKAEFTVAKDQNIRLRSGWFSDRSATYLAAGRPVITQDTAFDAVLPVGEGLFSFTTLEEAVEAVRAVNGDYDRHRRGAEAIAREYFDSDVVLSRLLEEIGV